MCVSHTHVHTPMYILVKVSKLLRWAYLCFPVLELQSTHSHSCFHVMVGI